MGYGEERENLGIAQCGRKRYGGGSGRTKKEKKEMSHFEKFVTEGNEKAEDAAKAGALLVRRVYGGRRAKTMQQEREEVSFSLTACSQLTLQQVSVREVWRKEQLHEDARNMHRTNIFVRIFCHDLVRRMDRQVEVLIWCRKCSGYARQRMEMNCCKLEQEGTKEYGNC